MKISVDVENGFDLFEQEIRTAITESLERGGHALREAIVTAETRVGDSDRGVWKGRHLRESFEVTPVQRDGFGGLRLVVAVVTLDPNWRWQNYGTHARRRRKVSASTLRRRQTASGSARYAKVAGSGGTRPLYFMSKGMRLAWPIFLETMRRNMPGDAEIGVIV